ncbi:hypothetical protein ATO2_09495 [Roseovarius sp. 22II1-1F6A]|nr:hypothetical protein ATO2_09495 [Roseovarius sp. 22II1-1F6A]
MKLKNLAASLAMSTALAIALPPAAAFAHHGVSGQFDLDQKVEVTGTVTRVRFVNPHSYVYFDAVSDTGEVENHRCELRSGSLLKRQGWSPDMFPIGSTVTFNGSPDRRDPLTCYAETVTFEDGRMLTRYGSVTEDGTFVEPEDSEEQAAEEGVPAPAATPDPDMPDLSGNWSEPVADGPPLAYAGPAPDYVLTDAGVEAADDWEPDDNPRFHCQPTNIILDYRFDQMINKIEQSAEEVKITYGFMDVVRTIHIDGSFPDTIEPSVTGYSVGTWSDGKLMVQTKGFKPGFLEAIGGRSTRSVPHSDQMEITEVFYIDDAGELVQEYTITDPVYLAEPHSHLNRSVKTEDAFIPYECDDLTEKN